MWLLSMGREGKAGKRLGGGSREEKRFGMIKKIWVGVMDKGHIRVAPGHSRVGEIKTSNGWGGGGGLRGEWL